MEYAKKTYNDIDLKKIRDDCGLDFAYHTYLAGQCCCCYGALDIPYGWAKGKRDRAYETGKFTGILFKNCANGRGRIKKKDEPITDGTCVDWECSFSQMERVCKMLQEQLGDLYEVEVPKTDSVCIVIRFKPDVTSRKEGSYGKNVYELSGTGVWEKVCEET